MNNIKNVNVVVKPNRPNLFTKTSKKRGSLSFNLFPVRNAYNCLLTMLLVQRLGSTSKMIWGVAESLFKKGDDNLDDSRCRGDHFQNSLTKEVEHDNGGDDSLVLDASYEGY